MALDKWNKDGCTLIPRDSKNIVAGHPFRA